MAARRSSALTLRVSVGRCFRISREAAASSPSPSAAAPAAPSRPSGRSGSPAAARSCRPSWARPDRGARSRSGARRPRRPRPGSRSGCSGGWRSRATRPTGSRGGSPSTAGTTGTAFSISSASSGAELEDAARVDVGGLAAARRERRRVRRVQVVARHELLAVAVHVRVGLERHRVELVPEAHLVVARSRRRGAAAPRRAPDRAARGCCALGAHAHDLEIEQVLALPVVEELAQHHPARDVLAARCGRRRAHAARGLRRDEVAAVAGGRARREQDLEAARRARRSSFDESSTPPLARVPGRSSAMLPESPAKPLGVSKITYCGALRPDVARGSPRQWRVSPARRARRSSGCRRSARTGRPRRRCRWWPCPIGSIARRKVGKQRIVERAPDRAVDEAEQVAVALGEIALASAAADAASGRRSRRAPPRAARSARSRPRAARARVVGPPSPQASSRRARRVSSQWKRSKRSASSRVDLVRAQAELLEAVAVRRLVRVARLRCSASSTSRVARASPGSRAPRRRARPPCAAPRRARRSRRSRAASPDAAPAPRAGSGRCGYDCSASTRSERCISASLHLRMLPRHLHQLRAGSGSSRTGCGTAPRCARRGRSRSAPRRAPRRSGSSRDASCRAPFR